LFDAIDNYFGTVRKRYADLSFELLHFALSDVDGRAWQAGESRDGTNRVTHSFVSDFYIDAASNRSVIECKPISKSRLDSVLSVGDRRVPYLLKVDVDGHETAILRGAQETLKSTSIVVVEAAVAAIRERVDLLEDSGFRLHDIVDPCYYHGVLSQVDLIFVSAEWIKRCPDLRPWQTKAFSWSAWSKFV
jgi:FkbM family methyltransferase